MNLELTGAAVSDLQSIRNYTLVKWGKTQERIYLDSLWAKFEEIASNPERFRFRRDLFPDCQVASHGKHVLLFRVRGSTLQIARILHGAMDFPRHLPDEL